MAYAIAEPARAPDGTYYEVAASPRGDLLLYQSETGPGSYLSFNSGVLGIASFFLNLIVFRRRWRVVVRQSPSARHVGPNVGRLYARDVPKPKVKGEMAHLRAAIEAGRLPDLLAATSASEGHQ